MQLDIFSLPEQNTTGKLPSANLPLNAHLEEALDILAEVAKLHKPVLVEGCRVRSRTAFKGKTAKLLRFEEICNVKFAVVEVEMYGSLIEYSCNVDSLEVMT